MASVGGRISVKNAFRSLPISARGLAGLGGCDHKQERPWRGSVVADGDHVAPRQGYAAVSGNQTAIG